MPRSNQLKALPRRPAPEEVEPPSSSLSEPLAQEIGGIGILILAGLFLISIFPSDSLLAHTVGPALLGALGAPGWLLVALGLAALGI